MGKGSNYLRVLLMGALLLFTACEQNSRPPLKIGINRWPGYEFLYLAQEKGFYQEQGVNVRIVEYDSLNDVHRGYERGKLDAMASTLVEVLQVKAFSNRDPQVVLLMDYSNGADVIIARSTIESRTDLKGKRIGADATSLPIYMLARLLESANLTLEDIELVQLEQEAMIAAFEAGDIDVAVTYPPNSIQLQARPDSYTIFSSKDVPGEIADVLAVEKAVITNRKSDVVKIFAAWDQALIFAEQHPEEAFQIMADREGITLEQFKEALSGMEMISLSEQDKYLSALPANLLNVAEVLLQISGLKVNVDLDCCVTNLHKKSDAEISN